MSADRQQGTPGKRELVFRLSGIAAVEDGLAVDLLATLEWSITEDIFPKDARRGPNPSASPGSQGACFRRLCLLCLAHYRQVLRNRGELRIPFQASYAEASGITGTADAAFERQQA